MTLADVGFYLVYALLAGCSVGLLGMVVLYGYWRLTEPRLRHSYAECAARDCTRHVKHFEGSALDLYCSVRCLDTEFRAGRV